MTGATPSASPPFRLDAGSGVPFVVGQNCVGASTCNGHACTEAGDATDQLGIITVQGQACP